MINLVRRRGLFRYTIRWFGSPSLWESLIFMQCFQSSSSHPVFGFVREPFFTILLNLKIDHGILLSNFRKNTRNEIQRALVEDIRCSRTDDIMYFIKFFNCFAEKKNLGNIDEPFLRALGSSLVITEARYGDNTLVMHAYVHDHSLKRARLLYSGSELFGNNKLDRARVGRANRLLHYWDMTNFQQFGVLQYDFGGYAYKTRDEKLKKINVFKEGFGGEVIMEMNYISIPFLIYRMVRKSLGSAFFRRRRTVT